LEITGNFRLPVTTTTTGIIKSGANTLLHTYGTNNLFVGVNAGNLTLSGGSGGNIGLGRQLSMPLQMASITSPSQRRWQPDQRRYQ